jgi:hypothetical protein
VRLSPHFSLEEFVQSQTGDRLEIDNAPSKEIVENLKKTAGRLEIVRSILMQPIIVTSGYRCKELNLAIGGSPNSAHTRGLAVDFICPRFGTPRAVAKEIIGKLDYDQLIYEYTWVHIGFDDSERLQVLTFRDKKYHEGLLA